MEVKVNLRLLKIEDEREVELKEGSTVKSLLERLTSIYGEDLKRLIGDAEKGFRVIVMANAEMVKYDQRLKDKDELSLILPVAGG
ncbi:MoaD/ThiS family protein [Candidatus Aerophobetes bacterium]|uniref:MoaD/ThiS family protein n=1 Tax=Aerophobetes bacterium TaxID=2030807 RepID=A0A523TFN6_UNCAE|nr:MAG: MoaD/ThiS family protein [Candidatus Aerophobetes bacterium]